MKATLVPDLLTPCSAQTYLAAITSGLETLSGKTPSREHVCLVCAQLTWTLNDNLYHDGGGGLFCSPTTPSVRMFNGLSGPANSAGTIPCYFYAPDVGGTGFNVQKYVNTTTGATRAFPGYGNPGDTSTTEVVMSAYADGSAAIATVTGPGVLASGFHSGFSGSGFTSGFSKPRVNAAGFAAGTARVPGALCYGTEAQVISAIVTASASLPAASYT